MANETRTIPTELLAHVALCTAVANERGYFEDVTITVPSGFPKLREDAGTYRVYYKNVLVNEASAEVEITITPEGWSTNLNDVVFLALGGDPAEWADYDDRWKPVGA